MATFGESMRRTQNSGQAPTLAAKLGFQDPDRKTPEHDEMVLWLDEKVRNEDFRYGLVGYRKSWDPEYVATATARADEWVHNAIALMLDYMAVTDDREPMGGNDVRRLRHHEFDEAEAFLDALKRWTPRQPPAQPELKATEITWEKPVGDPRWIAGFIDLYAELGEVAYSLVYSGQHGRFGLEEWAQRSGYKAHPPKWHLRHGQAQFAFEIKSRIDSLGDLVRQIRFYQEKGIRSMPFYVVSSDVKYITPLRNQGIGFIEYPSGEITHPTEGGTAR